MGVGDAAVAGYRCVLKGHFGYCPILVGHVLFGNDSHQIEQTLENGEVVRPHMPDHPICLLNGRLAGDQAPSA